MSDKTPIEPSKSHGSGLRFQRFPYRMREMVLGIGLVVFVLMSLLFIGLYVSVPKSPADGATNSPTSDPWFGTTPTPDPNICDGAYCLEATGYVRSLMNTSIDPCEDFYTYACGNWQYMFPLEPDQYQSSVMNNIFRNNEKKLVNALEKDYMRDMPWSAERKAKDFYSSCMDDYGRMVSNGNVLINKVLEKIGGWALAHDLPSDWSIQDAIEKVHVDFWTKVLFNIYVGTEYKSGETKTVININSGGLGMQYYGYYFNSYYNKTKLAYQDYMKKIATFLARDAKVTDATAKVNQFVDDVMTFETNLANITRHSGYVYTSSDATLYTLAQFNNLTMNMVDWVSFMKYLFDKAPITGDTTVRLRRSAYLDEIAIMINNIPGPANSRNRILNNYFVWQIAVKYSKDLSYEYIHARKQYYIDRYGTREFQDPADVCFNEVKNNMGDALSYIFIADHFADKNKEKVSEIASYVKRALIEGVDQMDFMEKSTKDYAKKKLSYTMDMLGYPDWLMDLDSVDIIYSPLSISKTNYFQNVLNMNVFDKIDMNNRYLQTGGENHLYWRGNTYHSYIYYHYSINELIAPAGVLQHPLYDYHIPHYLNFGAIGSRFAHQYLQAISKTGSMYGYHGELEREPNNRYRYKRWWTNSTINNYDNATKCFINFYLNKTAGSYTDGNGNIVEITYIGPWYWTSAYVISGDKGIQAVYVTTEDWVPVRPSTAKMYAAPAAHEAGSVKQAYYAYQDWLKTNSEKMAPIVKLSNEQMFFIAYAQTKCIVTRPYTVVPDPSFTPYFSIPDSLKLNGAVAMMDEFSKVFKCSINSTLSSEPKCSVF